jgi:hypothetical protein
MEELEEGRALHKALMAQAARAQAVQREATGSSATSNG